MIDVIDWKNTRCSANILYNFDKYQESKVDKKEMKSDIEGHILEDLLFKEENEVGAQDSLPYCWVPFSEYVLSCYQRKSQKSS